MAQTQLSTVARALQNRRRQTVRRTLSLIGDGNGGNIGSVAIRVPTFGDELKARLQAADWLDKNRASADPQKTLLVDVASVFLVSRCLFRVEENESKPEQVLVFAGPQFLWDRLSADELVALIDEVEGVARECSIRKEAVGDEFDSYMAALAECDEAGRDELLADKSRAWLAEFAHRAAKVAGQRSDQAWEFVADVPG